MNRLVTPLVMACVFSLSPIVCAGAHDVRLPLRPPNGTYVYSMSDDGRVDFKSRIVIAGSGPTFDVSETTKLPNGAIATTTTTWSSTSLLPLTFEVHQGKIALRAQVSASAVRFIHPRVSVRRIQGTRYILPSVGLIANDLMLGYLAIAHPGESFTLAEIQNNQTVRIRPRSASSLPSGPAGDLAIAVTKQKIHGNTKDLEQIVEWLNRKTGVIDGGRALPGSGTITLLRFTPGAPSPRDTSASPAGGRHAFRPASPPRYFAAPPG